MRRLPTAIAASVSTAMIVVGVTAIDSVTAHDGEKRANAADVAKFVDCLRDRGVQVPAVSGAALDRWLKADNVPMAAARACKTAIAPDRAAVAKDFEKIAACLRAQGLNPPTAPDELKRWMAEQDEQVLEKCGIGAAPACGDDKDEPES